MVSIETAIRELNNGTVQFHYPNDNGCTTEGEIIILLKRLAKFEAINVEPDEILEHYLSQIYDYLRFYKVEVTKDVKDSIKKHIQTYHVTPKVCAWYINDIDFYSEWHRTLGYTIEEATKILTSHTGEFLFLPADKGIIRFER